MRDVYFKNKIRMILLYKGILEHHLPELKRIFKEDIKILMDNYPDYKRMNSLLFYKYKIKVNDFSPY